MLLRLSLRLQGHALRARQPSSPHAGLVMRDAEVIAGDCERGAGHRQLPGGQQGLACSGGGSLPAPFERKPSGRGRCRPAGCPAPAGRRPTPQRSPMTAPARAGRAVLHAPGILSPRKITFKGARCARVAGAMALRATPECDLPRKDPAPIRRTGEETSDTRAGQRHHPGRTTLALYGIPYGE